MHPEKRNPATPTRARGADVGRSTNSADDTLSRTSAQRRLALKLAAGAGLSVAVASVIVVLALGDGGAP
jgi:hypothetical protein